MSTTHSYSTTCATAIVCDPARGDHAMYLDGAVIGFARTAHEAQTLLDQLVHELLPGPSSGVPLPPRDAVAEALQVLAAHDDEPRVYAEAARQLAAGITIAAAHDATLALALALRVRRHALLARRAAGGRAVCLGALRRGPTPAAV